MRIGIDARFYGSLGKGLGRYTQKLIENLEKIDQDNQYFIFLRKKNFSEYKPQNSNFKKVEADFPWYGFEEQFSFPRLLNAYRLDIVHFPHFNVPVFYFGRFVVTIHDLILIHFPTIRATRLNPLKYKFKFWGYRLVIKSALLRSSRVITVSKFTKRDILENYKKIPQEKIKVTYEACDDYCMLSPGKDEEILKKYGIIKPYIMYVGNAYPHKNLERLVLAFEGLKKEYPNLMLVFVGKSDYFYSRLKKLVRSRKAKDVVFLGYVPDYELDTLFHNVEVYVWPSLYEGFGLSPLEAMAKGAPVASSDHPCMREILGQSAHFFDGRRILDIQRAIRDVLNNRELKNHLVHSGYERVAGYSWKKMARQTLEIYLRAKKQK